MVENRIRYLGGVFSVLQETPYGDRIEYLVEDMHGIVFFLSKHQGNQNLFTEDKYNEALGIHPFYSTSFSVDSFIFQLDQNPAHREKVLEFLVSLNILEKSESWVGVSYKIKREDAIAWDNYFSLSYVIHHVKLLRTLYVSSLSN